MWLRTLSLIAAKSRIYGWSDGRGERIRTSGPCLPKTVLYQAELHPEIKPGIVLQIRLLDNRIDGIVGVKRENAKKLPNRRLKSSPHGTVSVKFA